MARIESSIGKSQFQIPQHKRLVVEDGTQPRSNRPERTTSANQETARELNPAVAAGLRRQAQEQMQETENRSVHDARRRVELITGLGRKTKIVPLDTPDGNIAFTLRTLKAFEQNCLSQVVENAKRIEFSPGSYGFTPTSLYDIKLEALSHSLFLVDGQSVDVILGTVNFEYEEQVSAKRDLLSEMDSALINHLFSQYEVLSQEVHDGYAPKNATEAEEVVDAIRKSGEDA